MIQAPLSASYYPADTSQPVLETTVGGVLRDAAARAPASSALIAGTPDPSGRRSWTYSQLLAGSEGAARALLERFSPGERVAIWANNIPEWVMLEFAAAFAGVTLVTVNPAFKSRELAHVLKQSRVRGLFLIPEFRGSDLRAILDDVRGDLPELTEVILLSEWESFLASGSGSRPLPNVSPDDAAQIQYTSGTTGFPKGAVLTHRGITNNSRFNAQLMGAKPGDVWVNPLPMFHTAGCVLTTLGSVQSLGTLVLMPAFDPALELELIETYGAKYFLGVPTMLIAMLEHADFRTRDLSSVKSAYSGGAIVPPALVRQVEATLEVPFQIIFGQTEASPGITLTRLDDSLDDRAETLGRAFPMTEVKIADPLTGETVPLGAIGELCTRGYNVMKGYFENPQATAEAIDPDGWLRTGDLGSMDERGYCRIEGRVKEMIIRGGENVYPREIEQLLFTHPAVADVAVVGIPDPTWGEQIAAFIRPVAGQAPSEEELMMFCRANLAAHKTPKHWVFVDAFPMTASGKVQKFVLRERLMTSRS